MHILYSSGDPKILAMGVLNYRNAREAQVKIFGHAHFCPQFNRVLHCEV